MKKVFQAIGPEKQAAVSTLIHNKIDFKPKLIRGEGEGHYVFIKGKIQQ